MTRALAASILLLLVSCGTTERSTPTDPEFAARYQFTAADRDFLARFSLARLPDPPLAPSNAVADNPAAARLGHRLFFDTALSANGQVACASCHQPQRYFTDGLARAKGIGTTRRNAPSLPPAVYAQWLYWDGRKDSLWSQALAPLEHPDEHGLSRLELARVIVERYGDAYRDVFGELPRGALAQLPSPASPLGSDQAQRNWQQLSAEQQDAVDRVFSNSGKALMAYQRQLRLAPARFDRFVDLLAADAPLSELQRALSPDEVAGLRIFMGQGDCASCHNGPLLSNAEFHNVGAPEPDPKQVDLGRYGAIVPLKNDAFTCLSRYSDAAPESCQEMRFLKREGRELVGAFKTPSLRNVAMTAPYMQAGQLQTLEQVVAHYNRPFPPFYDRAQHPSRPHFDILPLNLDQTQQAQLVAFLKTLTSPIPNSPWWRPPPS